jgi:hypothetical protein
VQRVPLTSLLELGLVMNRSDEMNDTYTFTFRIDPALNSGFTEAFNQGEPWWWVDGDGNPAAGNVDLTGAVAISVHRGSILVWETERCSQLK